MSGKKDRFMWVRKFWFFSENSFSKKCSYCPAEFTTKTSLARHEITHTDEKPFLCEICGKRFNRKGNLATHFAGHITKPTSSNGFKCFCGKQYKTRLVLITGKLWLFRTLHFTNLVFRQAKIAKKNFISKLTQLVTHSPLWLGLGPCKTKRNLRFFSKFNHNTVRWFQASSQRVLGLLVTWRCLVSFGKS